MLIALGSVKASPGVTVSTLALAAFRPGAAGVVIEADPAGGDVKAWRTLPGEPGSKRWPPRRATLPTRMPQRTRVNCRAVCGW